MSSPNSKNLTLIENALKQLTKRNSEDAFVIFADKKTDKFIQFAGSVDESLLLDLPTQTLSPQQLKTATEILKNYGAGLQASPLYDQPGGNVVDAHFGFNLDFGKEYEAAAKTTFYLMTKVYGLDDDFELEIEEN